MLSKKDKNIIRQMIAETLNIIGGDGTTPVDTPADDETPADEEPGTDEPIADINQANEAEI